ncbi:unnamed protein product [Ceratitis capitata]|uniref:(Mediterranean fruit fly) hypothetical protein n=1 Tax=Ceratitis capitata TaxID=7213 RepID=A0A811UP63_CERCA|nr:unnamed protein product [Ceratitis capitata]
MSAKLEEVLKVDVKPQAHKFWAYSVNHTYFHTPASTWVTAAAVIAFASKWQTTDSSGYPPHRQAKSYEMK